jgi:hypothetical protein
MIRIIGKKLYPKKHDYRRRRRFREISLAVLLTCALGLLLALIALFFDLQH